MPRPTSLLLAILLLAGLAAPAVRADGLPALPLPDCAANGLPINTTTNCEGTVVSFSGPAELPHPAVTLGISTRSVDFRRDEDRPGGAQTVTFTFDSPGLTSSPAGDGGTLFSLGWIEWPETLYDFNAARVSCREADATLWSSGCEGAPSGNGPNPDHVLLVRQGTCDVTGGACSYRVTWGPYDRRVRKPMLFRIKLGLTFAYTHLKSDDTYDGCGSDPMTGCLHGQGSAAVTFATTPPAPLDAIGTVRRIGAKAFEFDSTDSSPLVESVQWSLQYPVVGQPQNTIETSPLPVFTFDFADVAGIPGIFFETGPSATLQVTDHWGRTEFDFVPYSFLEPAGTEGPLQLTSFTLVGVDQDGRATLVAEVKNTTDDPIENVYVLGDDVGGSLQPDSTPQGITLAGNGKATFTVTLDLDDREEFTVRAKAFGATESGPVKSAPKTQRFSRDGIVGADTTVSQAAAAGDTTLHVASNDGFAAGDYVIVNLPGDNAEVRQVQALGSLILTTPLKYAHAAGEPVRTFVNDVDTAGPTITVTSPVEDAVVCQGDTVQALFTCSDAGAGVETCGAPITDGQTLDTGTPGARTTTLRAWDIAGNVTEKTVHWTVAAATGAGGCVLPTTTTTLPGSVTTTTVAGPGTTTTTTLPEPVCAGARECLEALRGRALCETPVTATLQRYIDRKLQAAIGKLQKAAAKPTKAVALAGQTRKLLDAIARKAAAFAKKKKGGIPAACRDAITSALAPARQRLGEQRF